MESWEQRVVLNGQGRWAHVDVTACNCTPLVQAAEAWEQRVVRYGQGQLGALEEHVARIGRENLQVRSRFFSWIELGAG